MNKMETNLKGILKVCVDLLFCVLLAVVHVNVFFGTGPFVMVPLNLSLSTFCARYF